MKFRLALSVALTIVPLSIPAQETTPAAISVAEKEVTSPWTGKATLGFLATTGNTDNSSLNTGFELVYKAGAWKHLAVAAAIYATENKMTISEAYQLGWKTERNISEHNFLFGRLHWRKDRFGAYTKQFSQSVGYGRRIIDTDQHELNADIGVGVRQSELLVGPNENETIFRGGIDYKWALSDTAEFRQSLSAEAGAINTQIESITALSAKLAGSLALVASYTIKHNTDVPPLTENTDTYTALSLEYPFM